METGNCCEKCKRENYRGVRRHFCFLENDISAECHFFLVGKSAFACDLMFPRHLDVSKMFPNNFVVTKANEVQTSDNGLRNFDAERRDNSFQR